jgi:hypothetical protein
LSEPADVSFSMDFPALCLKEAMRLADGHMLGGKISLCLIHRAKLDEEVFTAICSTSFADRKYRKHTP